MRRNQTRANDRRGIAYIMALILLSIFASLGLAFSEMTSLELKKSDNQAHGLQARMAAESGMALICHALNSGVLMPHNTTEETFTDQLYAALSAEFNSTGNLAGQRIAISGDVITIPQVSIGDGGFSCQFAPVEIEGAVACCLTVTGTSGNAKRKVAMNFVLSERRSAIFDHGVASRGKIIISGSGKITGMNDPSEARVLSTRGCSPAIQVSGSGEVGGDLSVTLGDEEAIVLGGGGGGGGGYSVGESSDPDTIMSEHVNLGVEEPEFPEINIAPFVLMAVNVIDSGTNLNGGGNVFDNIRVVAGTDPTFKNNAVINGVMYVEYPNVVSFRGQVTLNGIIVTEEPPQADLENCQIVFRGGFEAPGIAALPDDDPQFAALKEQTGTVILAPGFSLDFRGNSSAINGLIAADKLEFHGNSSVAGDMSGMILGLTDTDMNIHGSTNIRINRSGSDSAPAGFNNPLGLNIVSGSYTEPTGQ